MYIPWVSPLTIAMVGSSQTSDLPDADESIISRVLQCWYYRQIKATSPAIGTPSSQSQSRHSLSFMICPNTLHRFLFTAQESHPNRYSNSPVSPPRYDSSPPYFPTHSIGLRRCWGPSHQQCCRTQVHGKHSPLLSSQPTRCRSPTSSSRPSQCIHGDWLGSRR